MIKLHILEKMMQVVTTVSKAMRTVKDKVSKAVESSCRKVKKEEVLDKKESIGDSLEAQLVPKKPLTSKAKLFKQMVYLIKEDNIIYLDSKIQKQRLSPIKGEVVYIDFNYNKDLDYKKVVGYKIQERIKRHSRAPTHSSYECLFKT